MDTASKNRYLHFYPRSPCGERLYCHCWHLLLQKISIHALLAESDCCKGQSGACRQAISIHALLAESDIPGRQPLCAMADFYPRSPCGERRLKLLNIRMISHFYPRSPCGERQQMHRPIWAAHYFYPRSPCGERQNATRMPKFTAKFLSTLSLRRATRPCMGRELEGHISIHALLAESDRCTQQDLAQHIDFYPRSPCGERRLSAGRESDTEEFLSTLSLRRATVGTIGQLQRRIGKFLSTLSLRRATRHEHYNPG